VTGDVTDSVPGNANIVPASAEEIEKAITAAQAKISQVAAVFECCGSAFIFCCD